jgi:hypothetical protein
MHHQNGWLCKCSWKVNSTYSKAILFDETVIISVIPLLYNYNAKMVKLFTKNSLSVNFLVVQVIMLLIIH